MLPTSWNGARTVSIRAPAVCQKERASRRPRRPSSEFLVGTINLGHGQLERLLAPGHCDIRDRLRHRVSTDTVAHENGSNLHALRRFIDIDDAKLYACMRLNPRADAKDHESREINLDLFARSIDFVQRRLKRRFGFEHLECGLPRQVAPVDHFSKHGRTSIAGHLGRDVTAGAVDSGEPRVVRVVIPREIVRAFPRAIPRISRARLIARA
ncbi:hypothetical protein AKJ08_1468 [Vulgatibacter incomptus]|uniref:Uncharacterized protein n=1 Tax=Vulgatibacter incomptus TaxID=1391653 RepID=A0A0K1PCD8_9BACT|nr:hypothetical protein AKJ08_1468 [Vulgatibacter incomptus]